MALIHFWLIGCHTFKEYTCVHSMHFYLQSHIYFSFFFFIFLSPISQFELVSVCSRMSNCTLNHGLRNYAKYRSYGMFNSEDHCYFWQRYHSFLFLCFQNQCKSLNSLNILLPISIITPKHPLHLYGFSLGSRLCVDILFICLFSVLRKTQIFAK